MSTKTAYGWLMSMGALCCGVAQADDAADDGWKCNETGG